RISDSDSHTHGDDPLTRGGDSHTRGDTSHTHPVATQTRGAIDCGGRRLAQKSSDARLNAHV
ncbi:hypothetical protein BDZ89DRAFT_208204, partial [Hymenopellis radicata]